MLAHRRAHTPRRLGQFSIGRGPAQRLIGLQREFAVDTDRPRRIGQMNKAIRPPPVRERRLQRVAVRRQRLGHDIRELNFPKRPARLLVRQNILQRQHITRQLGDIVLRLVDGLQPLLQFPKRLRRASRGALQVLGHRMAHLRQPLFHQLQQMRLRRRLRLGHMIEPACQLMLPIRQPLHPLPQLPHLIGQRFRQPRRPIGGPQREDQKEKDQKHHPCADHHRQNSRIVKSIRLITDLNHVRPNSRSISDSRNST